MAFLALRIVGRIAHEDRDAAVGEMLLQPFHDGNAEAAEIVVRDQPDGESLAAMQALREVVRPKAQLLRDGDHLVARLLAQAAAVVQRLRRRAHADARRARDVADREPHARPARCFLGGYSPRCDVAPIRHRYFTTPLRKPET